MRRKPDSTITTKIVEELARARMWRQMGDEREADKSNNRINYLIDQLTEMADA